MSSNNNNTPTTTPKDSSPSDFKYKVESHFKDLPPNHKKVLYPIPSSSSSSSDQTENNTRNIQQEEVQYYEKNFLPLDEAIIIGSVFKPSSSAAPVTLMTLATIVGNITFLQFVLDQINKETKDVAEEKRRRYFMSESKPGETLPDNAPRTLTSAAIRRGHVDILRFLKKNNLLEPLVFSKNTSSQVKLPFHQSVANQHLECFKFFVEECNKDVLDPKNNNNRPAFELSETNPNCYYVVDSKGTKESILHDAARSAVRSKSGVLRYLLETKIKFDKFSTTAKTPFAVACLEHATHKDDFESLDLLVEYEMHLPNLKEVSTIRKLEIRKFNEKEEDKPLSEISRELHQVYLKYQCLPPAHESYFANDNTPILTSRDKKQELINTYIMTLIKNRVSTNSPIHIAASHGNLPLLKYLTTDKLGFKADANGKVTKTQTTPLILAVRSATGNDISVIKYLVDDLHADIDLCQADGAGPLYVGVFYNKPAAVRFLLERNANGSKLFDKRSTPFVGAISSKNFDMVKLLIEMKCDTSTKRLTQTPLEYSRALNGNDHPITQYIAQNA